MEVEMILLNLTNEILENARKEGREVVEVEMTPIQEVEAAEEVDLIRQVAEEADLIWQEAETQPTRGHYWTR